MRYCDTGSIYIVLGSIKYNSDLAHHVLGGCIFIFHTFFMFMHTAHLFKRNLTL